MPYLTPQNMPATNYCGRLFIPDNLLILAAVRGALLELTMPENWEKFGAVNPEDIAARMVEMYEQAFSRGSCMIGSLVHYATASPPQGVLPCDGSVYNRDDYPMLYDVIHPDFVIDTNTFSVPNIQDSFLLATGNQYTFGETGGSATHTLSLAEMPPHTHTYNQPTFNIDVESPGVPDPTGVGNPPIVSQTSSAGGGNAHNNMPPYTALPVGIVAS